MESGVNGRLICVGGVVLDGQRVLLVRHAFGHRLAGQWSIPWGIVDDGETPSDAVLRETREESGVVAAIEGFMGLQELPEQGGIGLIFLCRHVSGDPTPDGFEVDGARFFSLDEMDSLTEPIEPWCEWLVRRVLSGRYRAVPQEPDNPYHPKLAYL